MYLAPYLIVKALAYVGWCYLGVRLFRPNTRSPRMAALAFGFGRLALGIALGLFIFLAALSMNNATRNGSLTYVSIYVPVRILERSIWYVLMRQSPFRVAAPL